MHKTVAIAGLGAVGSYIASKISYLNGLKLVAVADRDKDEAKKKIEALGLDVTVSSVEELADFADIVVEALPASVATKLYTRVLERGGTLVALSSGVIVKNPSLVRLAEENGAQIIVPSGAIGGLDALKAAREGDIRSVKIVTTKAPKGLVGAPYLLEKGIDVLAISTPTKIFQGNALEAAQAFPANVNVAAAVSLAGIGAANTCVEVWVDPEIRQNTHVLKVESDSSNFEIELKNFPSPFNPKTSQLAALSVIAALREISSSIRI